MNKYINIGLYLNYINYYRKVNKKNKINIINFNHILSNNNLKFIYNQNYHSILNKFKIIISYNFLSR